MHTKYYTKFHFPCKKSNIKNLHFVVEKLIFHKLATFKDYSEHTKFVCQTLPKGCTYKRTMLIQVKV